MGRPGEGGALFVELSMEYIGFLLNNV
jgi:hypothetical protein